MAFLDPIFNPVLLPLLNKSPFLGIVVLGFVISLLITLVYKYFTNQEEMKRLKDQQKEFQQRMKGLKSNPDEMMSVQKEAMKANMEYMKHSFKATLITMLPVLIIFGWMTAHLAYEPIYPGEKYSITAQFAPGVSGDAELLVDEGTTILGNAKQKIEGAHASWQLQSQEGEHFLTVRTGQEQSKQEQIKKVLITQQLTYEPQISNFQNSGILNIRINYKLLHPLGTFSIFGWEPGWLGLYIILSIIFSMGLRKVLNIY
ncbi:DUF106 domain-containing protein [Candidatus Woesearchaeota archaeon]|nr:DUF106 domain-containing protein [Candidatus Woesearchaeota archaeon]